MFSLTAKRFILVFTVLNLFVTPGALLGLHDTISLKQLCSTHNQVLESSLMSIMHEVETSLAYWQTMEDTPFSYAVIRGPKGWISSKNAQDEIQEHIEFLSNTQNKIATALGSLTAYQTKEDTITNPKEINAACAQCFGLMDTLLVKTDMHPPLLTTSQGVKEYGIKAINQLPTFYNEWLTSSGHHLKPNHFIRNWTKYTLGGCCLIAATIFAYKNPDKLSSWQHDGKEAILKFWKKQIKAPLENTRDILFGRKHIEVITPEAVAGSKNSFLKSLDEILPIIKPEASQEELAALRTYILETKDSSILVEFWGKQAKHLIWNTVTNPISGNLHFLETNASLIQLKDWQLNQATLSGQQQWEAQQLNAELLAIFPVMLGLYGLKKGFDALFHGKIVSEPLQNRLMVIDKLLNTYNTGDLQLDTIGIGYLKYHLTALTQHATRIPHGQQKTFKADISELENPTLNVGQKLRVLDQMYRQYSFLNPLAV